MISAVEAVFSVISAVEAVFIVISAVEAIFIVISAPLSSVYNVARSELISQ